MIVLALHMGHFEEAALLLLAMLFLFCFLPLLIVVFIIYRVVVSHEDPDHAITLDLNRPTSS